jgi:HEPN domain-containing protein
MSDAAQSWAEQSQYDLETARAMLESGRHLYVLFCCQQSVEKALKALIVRQTGGFPPRIHNLVQLAESAGVETLVERRRFLGELTAYYIQSRYPEEIRRLGSTIRREVAEETLKKTEVEIQWLLSRLT